MARFEKAKIAAIYAKDACTKEAAEIETLLHTHDAQDWGDASTFGKCLADLRELKSFLESCHRERNARKPKLQN